MEVDSGQEIWEDEEVVLGFDDDGEGIEDNEEAAWPLLRALLKQQLSKKASPRVLDFGCGTGQLALDLASKDGFTVVGLDRSRRMIARARERQHPHLAFQQGTLDDLASAGLFDAVASSLVLPFIEGLELCCQQLTEPIAPGGTLAFATFNPDFVAWQTESGTGLFVEKDDGLHIVLEKREARVFVRSAREHEDILAELGFSKLAECYLVFSGDISARSPGLPLEKPVPRFLVMSFKKLTEERS